MTRSQTPAQFKSREAIVASLAMLVILLITVRVRADQTISISTVAPNTVMVRIDQPIVTQAVTQYPQVQFQPGDTVTVDAGGCVQTGGVGKTWKRYVNPSGPNSDRLYHGEIWIPGATPGLSRISGWIGKTLAVPTTVDLPGQLFLRLGYEDDGYGDNGYWGHDDGTEDQCKGSNGAPAYVVLTIKHGGTPPPPNPEHPYDLVWSESDGNSFPMDPRWTAQTPAPGILPGQALCGLAWLPPCTTQTPSVHVGTLCAIGKAFGQAGELGGHANWGVATYDGYADWDGHSSPATDDDYNINLTRSDQAFYTSDNPNDVHTEFDSDETIDHFHTPWWSSFHGAVDNSDAAAGQYINGKYMVAMGVAGLDCAHSCGSEIHPVFAMALHVEDDAAADTWAIFARNWGDEGFCGDEELGIDVSSVTLTIPWRAGATGVTIKDGAEFLTNNSSVTGPIITPTVGSNVAITFTLPAPEAGARVNGVLYLQWTGTPAAVARREVLVAPRAYVFAMPAAMQKQLEPEASVTTLVTGMSPELQKEYAALTPPKSISMDSVALHVTVKEPLRPGIATHEIERTPRPEAEVAHAPIAVMATVVGKKLPPVRAFPNPKKADLDRKRLAILQRAYPHLAESTR